MTMGSLNNKTTTTLMRTNKGDDIEEHQAGIEDCHNMVVKAIQRAKKILLVQEGGRPKSEDGTADRYG
jgi:hypothetical protein